MRAVLITTLIAIAVSGSAAATDTGGKDDRTMHLYQQQSNPGESMDDFVARISPRAIEVTEQRRVPASAGCPALFVGGRVSLLVVHAASSFGSDR